MKQANEIELRDRLVYGVLKGQEELLLQLKGQILTLEELIDIKHLLFSEIETEEFENKLNK